MVLTTALICATIIAMGVFVLCGIMLVMTSQERRMREYMAFEEKLLDKFIAFVNQTLSNLKDC